MAYGSYSKTRSVFHRSQDNTSLDSVDEFGVKTHRVTSSDPTSVEYSAGSSGFYNPYHKQQIRLGQNATTSFSGNDVSPDPSPWFTMGTDQVVSDKSTHRVSSVMSSAWGYKVNPVPGLVIPSGSTSTDVNNRAIRKFLAQVQAIQSSVEAGQDLGEIKQTIESLLHPMSSLKNGIVGYLEALRKRKRYFKRQPFHRASKILGDTYLEFHFGWQPLAADVASIIADFSRQRFPSYPVSATATDTYNGSSVDTTTSFGYLQGSASQNRRTTSRYTVRLKGMVKSRQQDGFLSLAQSLQLTPDRWLPTAWDLLPYSWLVDYFVNVGDIFNGMAFINSSLAWGCKTTRTQTTLESSDFKLTANSIALNVYDVIRNDSYSYGGNHKLFSRSITRSSFDGSDLLPAVQFKLPTSAWPFTNIGAILAQKSRSLVPLFKVDRSVYTE
jgi:hypothetical protein